MRPNQLIVSLSGCVVLSALRLMYPDAAAADVAGPDATGATARSVIDVPQGARASSGNADWTVATRLALARDVVHGRPASESTVVSVMTDRTYLYVRFDAKQREPVAAAQRTNNVGSDTDDEVWVDLWPAGAGGFHYQFAATPLGTHFQSSSENTSYEPTWDAKGALRPDGYGVELRIPFAALRGAHEGAWRAQFVRSIHATGEQQVWTWAQAQSRPSDLAYAGTLRMPPPFVARPAPRVALYGLGAIASSAAGGSTSRNGADISVPLTATSSLYATIHPDFSNVELDQQSISPTAYQRYYSEVRPFFTQAANAYNNLDCDVCPGMQELYTPAIPTPRDGYAIEGHAGLTNFAAFDAVGVGRQDVATALTYQSADTKWLLTAQRVAVTSPSLVDDVATTGVRYSERKYFSAYLNYGHESGTNVVQGSEGQRYDGGGGWSNQTFAIYGSARKVGDYYDPADGYIAHPGIAGYGLYADKIWLGPAKSTLASIALGGEIDRYHGRSRGLNQTDNQLLLDVLTRAAVDVQLSLGSSYLRSAAGVFSPVSQNGIALTWHSGLKQDPSNLGQHGASAFPTTVSYNTGRYGDGRLDTWLRSSTLRVGRRGSLTLELDDTNQASAQLSRRQWFERVGYAFALGQDSSLALGVRRSIGTPPEPSGGGNCIGSCSNVSFSYHVRRPHGELYLGYGDPNALRTAPQAIVKLIYYIGAEKGT